MVAKHLKLITSVFLAVVLVSSPALSNGLNLNGLGSKAVSMGGAFIGLADDFSLIYWNPAGAGFLKGAHYGAYLTDLIPTNRYQVTLSPELSIEAKTKLSHYLGFLTAYYRQLSDQLVVGFGLYTPSGLGANWKGDDFKAMTMNVAYDWTSKIGMVTLSPLIAWRVSDRISVGATLNFNYGLFSLKRWAGEMETEEGMVDLGQYEESMHGWGLSASFGILTKLTDWLSAGLTVKTPTTIKLKGTAEMLYLGYIGYSDSSDLRRNIKWPWFFGGGVAIKPTSALTLTADLQWTGWSVVERLETSYLDPVWQMLMAEAGNDRVLLDWNDRMQVRFGFEYRFKPTLSLRLGYYSDPSPAPDYTLNILLPSFNFQAFSAGLGYDWKGLSVSWAVEYLAGKKREVSIAEIIAAGTLGQAMPGTYRMHLLVPNLSVSYRF